MGNTSSTSKSNKAMNGSSSRSHERLQSKGRSKKSAGNRRLEDHDLDDIYNFIKQVKNTNEGEDLLKKFLARQASDVQELEDVLVDLKGPFPIQSICIVDTEKPNESRKHRPTVPPSA